MYACTGEYVCKERILGIWQQLLMWKTALGQGKERQAATDATRQRNQKKEMKEILTPYAKQEPQASTPPNSSSATLP